MAFQHVLPAGVVLALMAAAARLAREFDDVDPEAIARGLYEVIHLDKVARLDDLEVRLTLMDGVTLEDFVELVKVVARYRRR